MFCRNCGNQLAEGTAFCPKCGTRTNGVQIPANGTNYANQGATAANPINGKSLPVRQLDSNRDFLKYLLLSLVTCGIYSLVFMTSVSSDVNLIASKYDGKKTMHYCLLAFLIVPITFGIGYLVWNHNIANRVDDELTRRGIAHEFGAKDFWLWGILGSFIIVGPFMYMSQLIKAVNLLAENYNANG
jgi:hypothetical protein